jgi:CubicO group peptidase (beta-lactamase class C family)
MNMRVFFLCAAAWTFAWPSRAGEVSKFLAAFQWQEATPESQRMSSARLEAARAELEKRDTKTLLIIRHDRIVYEWYAAGCGRTKPHYTASLAKALVGGVSLDVAINDGLLKPDDPAWKYISQWRDDPKKSKILIRHLATHSSGIEDAEEGGKPHDQLTGWKGAFWKRVPDPFTIARDQTPVVFEPGSAFAYSNPGMAMLAYAVTASLSNAIEKDIRMFLRERIMRPIEVPDGEWSVGYNATYEVDGLRLVANWGGGSFSPNAVARIGRLFLRKGNWAGRQILRPEIVDLVLRDAGAPRPDRSLPEGPFPRMALCWYTNGDGVWPGVPRDAFCGAGAGNQALLVVPSLELIIVRNGSDLERGNFWGGLEKFLFNPVVAATKK